MIASYGAVYKILASMSVCDLSGHDFQSILMKLCVKNSSRVSRVEYILLGSKSPGF